MAIGRPKLKQKKIKVGFALNVQCVDCIDLIAEITGKTKSRIVEEAILELSKTKGYKNEIPINK